MPLIPLNLTGGDYQHKSRPLSNQVTRNFWAQKQQTNKAQSDYVLQSFYGLDPWAVGNMPVATAGRGLFVNQGQLYRVADTTLYKVASDGTHTALGNIPGSNRCIFDAIASGVTVVANRAAYQYNGAIVSQITDVNMGTPLSCSSMNSQMLYDNNGDVTAIFNVSNAGDATTINGLNNATAENESSALRRVFCYKQVANMMKQKSIELWWDSGQGNPPFDRIQGGIIDIGLDALYSVAKSADPDSYMFLFGSDKQVHSITGGTGGVDTVISTPAMAKQFQDYAVTSDAIGWTMKLEGQLFYVLTFPIQDITWVYPVGGEWFQWGSGVSGRIRATDYASVYGKHIVEEGSSGNLYLLDPEVYTDAGDAIIRTRDSGPIHGGLLQAMGKEFEVNSIEIILETGVGLTAGQGSDPRIMISMSKDGGKTFGTERQLKCGTLGQVRTVRTGSFGRFKSCVIRLRVSDPIYWNIYSAVAYLEVCV